MIKFKRGTFETLSSINPIIDSGQPCVATNYNGGGAKTSLSITSPLLLNQILHLRSLFTLQLNLNYQYKII